MPPDQFLETERPADGDGQLDAPEASEGKTVFTTGEVAKICKVSQQTIIRCFDNGSLKGFRVPGSRHRRIPRDRLEKFMRDNHIPLEYLNGGVPFAEESTGEGAE